MPIFESWLDRAGRGDSHVLDDREAYSASPSHERFLPKLATVMAEGYGWTRFRADFLAGITVAVVALPLAMALGIASGASPDKGLVTAVVAGLLISLLGGSRVQIGGPTGAFVVVVFGVIAKHGYDGLVLATLLAGIILIVAGYSRLGGLVRFVPAPVVTGFTAGIAIIIATSQVMDIAGLSIPDVSADFLPRWQAYIGSAGTFDGVTLAVGLGCLVVLLLLRRFAPKLPAYLIVIILSALVVRFWGLDIATIGSRFPDLPSGLPKPALPDFGMGKVVEVLPAAFTIAFLAGIEALLSAVVADGMTGYRHRSNQELVAQGVANMGSALFGGLPATGAIARTATNVRSGGTSPVSGIIHSAALLLFVLFASDLMKLVPMATLAAVLLMVAWGMSEAGRFISLLRISADDRAVLLITFGLTVLVDLTVAIGVGVTLASLMFMARMARTVQIGAVSDNLGEEPGQRDALPEGVEVFRIAGPFFFGVAGELVEVLKRIARPPRAIILRMEDVPFLDSSGLVALAELRRQCARLNSAVILCMPDQSIIDRLAHIQAHGPAAPLHLAADFAQALEKARTL
ncbi:SulP family inorganic anion transporter [Rhizorhapis sp. SPR117]|uniref:SulP family inorganic anion transporter n=1 Tax=Rhizorhapis sp. SPR117 TaxID=2912611 RepID=UPI001F014CB1|nr:STAS domain-containing protein [Rhizorhapis sp. SPR117]